jgi:hypothetical protein
MSYFRNAYHDILVVKSQRFRYNTTPKHYSSQLAQLSTSNTARPRKTQDDDCGDQEGWTIRLY